MDATRDNPINMGDADSASFTPREVLYNNVTTLNTAALVEEANRKFTITLIPCIVYMGVLIFIGIVGNSLVLYVFGFRLKRSPQNFFILLLAALDLLSCAVGLPTEMTDVTLHFKFKYPALCKTMRFVNGFTTMCSICTLIAIAVDRFRRVRKPLGAQITNHQARLSLIPILVASLVFSTPSIYVYGLRTVEIGYLKVTGLDCTISDEAKVTIVPLVYNGVLFVCFLVLAASLIIMYTLILRSLHEHVEMLRKASTCTTSTVVENFSETESGNDESSSTVRGTDADDFQQNCSNGDDDPSKTPVSCVEKMISKIDLNEENSWFNNDPYQSDENSSASVHNQSSIRQENDNSGSHMGVHDTCQNDSPKNARVLALDQKGSYDSNKNPVAPDSDKDTEYGEETSRAKLPIPKSDQTQDKSNDDFEMTNPKIIDDPKSVDEEAAMKRAKATHHVSFRVRSSTSVGTDQTNSVSPVVTSGAATNKRKPSQNSLSVTSSNQSEESTNEKFQSQKRKESRNEYKGYSTQNRQKQKKPGAEGFRQRKLTRKTTIIAFVVTLVFIISFVPHLCLQVAHLIRKGFDEELEGAALALYNTFLRSYFINNVANPIIYGLMNEKFRSEVKLLATPSRICRKR